MAVRFKCPAFSPVDLRNWPIGDIRRLRVVDGTEGKDKGHRRRCAEANRVCAAIR